MRRLVIALAAAALSAQALAADITANRTLRAGTLIVAGDLSAATEEAKATVADLVGLELRRTIYVGRAVALADLGPPTLVRRNEIVIMTYRSGALGLRTEGRALAAGGLGERVEVMNLDTRTTVRGTVSGPRHVEVTR